MRDKMISENMEIRVIKWKREYEMMINERERKREQQIIHVTTASRVV